MLGDLAAWLLLALLAVSGLYLYVAGQMEGVV